MLKFPVFLTKSGERERKSSIINSLRNLMPSATLVQSQGRWETLESLLRSWYSAPCR